MSLGLIGRKVGMTRLFTDEGDSIPVTVIDVSDNRVAQIKTQETDGYDAIQLAHGTRRATRVTKPMAGHFAKAGVMAGNALNEFHLDAAKIAEMKPGQVIPADAAFAAGQKVDVQGVSIGMAQDPGRVFPGKRMTGHLGDVTRTVQNLVIARIDTERNLIMVKGAVPGAPGGKVIVTPAVKTPLKKK